MPNRMRAVEGGVHPTGYTLTIRAAYPNRVGMLGKITSAIGEEGGDIGAIDIYQSRRDLSPPYTPGVARICQAIHKEPMAVWSLTIKRNTVAVVTDGTAVLGLGDIGPAAALPVMEGKAMLFKEFGGVAARAIRLATK